jgi:hypothetical protein
MDWQQFVSLAIVASAAFLLFSRKFRRRKFDFHRDTHCGGCAFANGTAVPQHSVVYRARKGERPQVFVKMK